MSGYEVFWTEEALDSFELNNDYLFHVWGESVLNSFLKLVEGAVHNIRNNPKKFQFHNQDLDIRKCIVNKRVTLFYKIVNDSRIDIITFWNNWHNPEKLKF